MNYAKYIDIPNWETFRDNIVGFRNRDLEKNKDWPDSGRHIWWCYFKDEVDENVPGLIETFKSLGLTMRQMILFNNVPNDINVKDHNNPKSLFIHTDSQDDSKSPYDGYRNIVTNFVPTHALNIPLVNCEGSTTIFYKRINDNPEVFHVNPGCGGWAHQDVEEVSRFHLNKPAVLRINIPHAVWNPHNSDRIVATFRFEESLEKYLQ